VSDLKPTYLIWGDDQAKLDSWRSRLRARARSEGPETSLEILRDERLTAEAVAAAGTALTLSVGRRYLLADGVERWKDREVQVVEAALAEPPPDTVIVFISEGKPPARLVKAVERAGGDVHACEAPKPSAYPAWLAERARERGFDLDREAARALVDHIGTNQQRLLRELEKLALFAGPEGRAGPEAVDALVSSAVEARTFELADAVVEGDGQRALRLAEELRAQGDDIMHILFALLRQLEGCRRSWAMMAAGKPASEIQSALRVPQFVARRMMAQARRADPERLERALDLLADLDYAVRGAGQLDVESALTLTLAAATRVEAA
jgi:DNA polymerase III subunit delta